MIIAQDDDPIIALKWYQIIDVFIFYMSVTGICSKFNEITSRSNVYKIYEKYNDHPKGKRKAFPGIFDWSNTYHYKFRM